MNKLDKTGATKNNKFGSKMTIIKYRNAHDIDVYFEEYDWTYKHAQYSHFKNGSIKCPYEKRYYGVGYIGKGKYTGYKNSKITKCHKTWIDMLERCYDKKCQDKNPTYKGCTVCNEWHNYQNFAEWYYNNYYEIKGEQVHLDKDIIIKNNKEYSYNTCVFVPQSINNLFCKSNKLRENLPIGVSVKRNKYRATIYINGKQKSLGSYNTPEEAFIAYKTFKENYIKAKADSYRETIPEKLYNAMYEYEVEVDD